MSDFVWRLKRRLFETFRNSGPFKTILEKENQNLVYLLNQISLADKRVLDLGVGTGNVLNFLKDAHKVIGIDFSESMLHSTKKHFPEANLVRANVAGLPIRSDCADLVTAVGLVEYLKDIIPLVEEVNRTLKHKGYFLLTFSPPNIWTRLRLFLGQPLYPRNLEQVASVARFNHFELCDHTRSMMQVQVLLVKKENGIKN